MNKTQKEKVIANLDAAIGRFTDIRNDYEDERTKLWMDFFIMACDVARDAVEEPRPPRFDARQRVLLGSAFAYIYEARRALPIRWGYVKGDNLLEFIGKIWDLHVPFLDVFRGHGHPSEETKKKYGIK